MEKSVKTICAWCDKLMVDGDSETDKVSHGICTDCYSLLLSKTAVDIKSFIDDIKTPVLIIQESGRAQLANAAAEELTGKRNNDISEMLGGDIFECIHSKEPGGCGCTIHCKACTIRNSVEYTQKTGEPLYDIPATLTIKPYATEKEATSSITTIRKEISPGKYVVCLTIKDFKAS